MNIMISTAMRYVCAKHVGVRCTSFVSSKYLRRPIPVGAPKPPHDPKKEASIQTKRSGPHKPAPRAACKTRLFPEHDQTFRCPSSCRRKKKKKDKKSFSSSSRSPYRPSQIHQHFEPLLPRPSLPCPLFQKRQVPFLPQRALSAQIRLSHLRQSRPAQQLPARDHEVAIPPHDTRRLSIQPRQHDSHERRIGRLVVQRQGAELGDPHGHVEVGLEREHVVLEGGRLLLRGAAGPAVPVRDGEVERAGFAIFVHELVQPGRAHERGGGVRVRDGRSAELDAFAGEGVLDVLHPVGSGETGVKLGAAVLCRLVGLVEAENKLLALLSGGEGGGGVGDKGVLQSIFDTPQHGNEVEG